MKRTIPMAILTVCSILLLQFMVQMSIAAPLEDSHDLEYLGEGGSYTLTGNRHFIVKRLQPFRFKVVQGPTYTAESNERVWASTKGAPKPWVDSWHDLGFVPEDCKVSYMAIDDDPDDRINTFYLDDEAIHDMPQGMVTGGQFRTERAGRLRVHAIDSIGIWINKCPSVTPTPTSTATIEPSPTTTSTPGSATPTPTNTAAPPEITVTGTPPTTTPTATATRKPTQTPTKPAEGPSVTPSPTPTKKPRLLSCLRINFEVSGDEAREGIYEVREVGGRLLYSWYADEGWRDSGWIYNIDISFENVYVEVFYVPEDGPRIRMEMHNPAPGTNYGWMTRGKCHALEVGWPDETITPTPTPDASDGFNDEFDLEKLDLQRFLWPEIQPTPTNTPASSLRG